MAGTVSSAPRVRGELFGKYARALLIGKGDVQAAHAFAMGQGPNWRECAEVYKAAVDALSTTGETALMQPVAYDLAEALRPATLVGRIPGARRAPFNSRLITLATGAVAHWVGETLAVPASALDFDTAPVLKPTKIQSLSVATHELLRWSAPAADSTIAADAIKAAAFVADTTLTDPDNAGSAVKPASITYGATAIPSSGSDVAAIDADLKAVIAVLTAADIDLSTALWMMNPRSATHLGLLRGSGGAAAFPGIGPKGGLLLNMPVLTSGAIRDASSPTECPIILIAADQLLLADDGEARVTVSAQASIELSDAPTAGAAQVVSLWQAGLAALLCERAISWKLRRAAACAYVSGVQF